MHYADTTGGAAAADPHCSLSPDSSRVHCCHQQHHHRASPRRCHRRRSQHRLLTPYSWHIRRQRRRRRQQQLQLGGDHGALGPRQARWPSCGLWRPANTCASCSWIVACCCGGHFSSVCGAYLLSNVGVGRISSAIVCGGRINSAVCVAPFCNRFQRKLTRKFPIFDGA